METHDQMKRAKEAGLPTVFIQKYMTPRCSSRGGEHFSGWQVLALGHNLAEDPNGHFYFWQNRYARVFNRSNTPNYKNQEALEAAKKWASERFGVEKWSRNGMGCYVDLRVQKQFPVIKR